MGKSRARGAAWACAWCVALAAVAAPALAHHSFAMFDNEHQIRLYGTVARFEWTNPHVYIYLDVAPGTGDTAVPVKHYTIECANPGILDRVGWKWNMIKVGDRITTVVAPLRSGKAGGLLKVVRLANGSKYTNGAPAGKATIELH